MLVLTRKVGEGLMIGGEIQVTILDEKEGRIRVGIKAPQHMKIYRQEIYDRICQENREASTWELDDLHALSSILTGHKAGQ